MAYLTRRYMEQGAGDPIGMKVGLLVSMDRIGLGLVCDKWSKASVVGYLFRIGVVRAKNGGIEETRWSNGNRAVLERYHA